MLGVLRAMVARSPEVRELLRDVKEQVEALDRVERMRRTR
jgi:hypothetical protein